MAGKNLQEEATLAIIREADRFLQSVSGLLKPYSLSPTQYNVLRILRGAGPKGASAKDIGGKLVARDPDVTRLMDRLEKRGLLTRERAKEDRRIVVHCLTGDGLALLNELDGPIAALHRANLRGMSAAKLQNLIAILNEFRIQT